MKNTIVEQRNYSVIKSNEFIQRSRFKLSVPEQKIIWYLVSKIKFEDEEFKYYDFNISEFCKVCNIDHASGGNYDLIKESLKNLSDKSMWIETDDENNKAGKIELVRWLDKVIIYKQKGVISVRFDEVMSPYFLKLKGEYTSLDLSIALVMERKYSIRLYEILKSYSNLSSKKKYFEIADLKTIIDAENYEKFYDFKRYVLIPALDEINKFADFKTDYKLGKTGRSYTGITFYFSGKTLNQHYDAVKKIESKLNRLEEQISFS